MNDILDIFSMLASILGLVVSLVLLKIHKKD